MQWVFFAFLLASMIHMGEEYFYPGGFMEVMKRFNPRFASLVTIPMAVIVNGLQLLLCIIAIAIGKHTLIFSMSIAGLLFTNSLMHIMGSIRQKGYMPGVVSGALLYLPLSVYAYYLVISSGILSLNGAVVSGILGLLYQAVPISYFGVASALKQA